MKPKLLVATALAAVLVLSTIATPAAADHGGEHTIELYGSATFVDGTALNDTNTVALVAIDNGTSTTLDSTTLTPDGEIANQSTGAGTPLSANVTNGTDLRLVVDGNQSATEFPDDLIQITNASGAYHVDLVVDTGQSIDESHTATLETEAGDELARWDGSNYVDTTDDETTDTTDTDDDSWFYWSFPGDDPSTNETTQNDSQPTTTDDEPGWFDSWFGTNGESPPWLPDWIADLRGD